MYSKHFVDACKYACSNLSEIDIARVLEAWGQHYNMPYDVENKIIDYMDEYGMDNYLEDGWWESEGDTEEVFLIGTDPLQE